MTSKSNLPQRLRSAKGQFDRRLRQQLMRVLAPIGHLRALPDFLIVGAMKSGTTTLFHYLTQHPGIAAPTVKEVHFFDVPRNFKRGENWYRAHFPSLQHLQQTSQKIGYPAQTGEATPAMFINSYAANVTSVIPQARIIMILRDPVERAYSHYQHQKRKIPRENLSFLEALQMEQERIGRDLELSISEPAKVSPALWRYSYAERGKYFEQIENWLTYFPESQIEIVNFNELKARPDMLCNRLCTFLGLPEYDFSTTEHLNSGGYGTDMDDDSREYLTEFFRPHNRRLFDFLGEDWGWPS
jgi:hypothetical protein